MNLTFHEVHKIKINETKKYTYMFNVYANTNKSIA